MRIRPQYKLNIFALDQDPTLAAQYANDMHVSKMTTETAQILSTITRIYTEPSKLKPESPLDHLLYSKTHASHPCVIWVGYNEHTYQWTYQYFQSLATEYSYRYGRQHGSWERLGEVLSSTPDRLIPSPHSTLPGFDDEDLFPLTPPSLIPPRLIASPELMKKYYGDAYISEEDLVEIQRPTRRTGRAENLAEPVELRPILLPMPETWENVVDLYREYYFTSKFHIAKWTNRPIPTWFQAKANRTGIWEEQVKTRKLRGRNLETRSILFS
jgi:hypothetical protein